MPLVLFPVLPKTIMLPVMLPVVLLVVLPVVQPVVLLVVLPVVLPVVGFGGIYRIEERVFYALMDMKRSREIQKNEAGLRM